MYSVTANGDKKASWTEIGAAWPHKERRGSNLQFMARSLEGVGFVDSRTFQSVRMLALARLTKASILYA